jgi:hypothetical protein
MSHVMVSLGHLSWDVVITLQKMGVYTNIYDSANCETNSPRHTLNESDLIRSLLDQL